jgi:membrane protease YdiL (CAAX protease family)
MTLARWLRRHPMPGFFVLTFAWSWACWALSPAIQPHLPWLATLLMFGGSFGPSLAAIVVVASTRPVEGLRAWLLRCLQWHIGWGWWAVALLLPLAVMLLAAGLHVALGGDIATAPASGHLLMTAVNLPLVLLLGGPVGEEFGWRGYALPVLQDRLGWRAASLGLGLVWGVWHLPLFFIDGTAQARIPLALFLLSVVAMSVVFAWLVNRTAGSVVAALLFHTAINFWPSVVPVLPTEASYRAYAFVVVTLVLLALVALLTSGPMAGPAAVGVPGFADAKP